MLNLQGNEITDNNHTEITGAEKSKLMPTDTGIVVNDFLIEYFPDILDYNFTASVEKQFDEIAEGDKQWTAILKHSIRNSILRWRTRLPRKPPTRQANGF